MVVVAIVVVAVALPSGLGRLSGAGDCDVLPIAVVSLAPGVEAEADGRRGHCE